MKYNFFFFLKMSRAVSVCAGVKLDAVRLRSKVHRVIAGATAQLQGIDYSTLTSKFLDWGLDKLAMYLDSLGLSHII